MISRVFFRWITNARDSKDFFVSVAKRLVNVSPRFSSLYIRSLSVMRFKRDDIMDEVQAVKLRGDLEHQSSRVYSHGSSGDLPP